MLQAFCKFLLGQFVCKLLILCIIILAPSLYAEAQETDTTTIIRNDTTIQFLNPKAIEKTLEGRKLEEILEEYSDRNIFSKKLHEWLVKSSFEKSAEINENSGLPKELIGKKIRSIDIRHIQPFGGSVYDTTATNNSWLTRVGNKFRFETASSVILKTITIQEGSTINRADINDSERLLRSLSFINEARIVVWPHPTIEDEVNISLYVQDRYPHAISFGFTNEKPSISLMNKNLLGRGISLAHTLVAPSFRIGEWGFRETLGAENFLGEFINFEIDYSQIDNLKLISGKVQREFVLPETKYAGGMTINRSFENPTLRDYPSIEWAPPLDFSRQNFWAGRSFLLNEDKTPVRSNFYITARLLDLRLFNQTEQTHFLPDGRFYYGGIALSKRGYYQNNLIYSFGRTEDVPFGYLSYLAYGYHSSQKLKRHFISYHHSWGRALIPSKGYLYLSGDIGSFFNSGKPEQSFMKLSGEYISPLIELRNSKLRNFFELEYVKGFNRLPDEYLYIDEDVNGLHRFDYKSKIRGSEKIVLKTEQVFFTPHEPLGFKFTFFTFFDTALLRENPRHSIFEQTPYFSFGGGLRIRNDNLVFNTLQIRLAIMPRVPSGELPLSLRTTGESIKDFRDFVPSQPGNPVFY
ncbi:hypothetical protein DDZ16_14570 [Marinilabilia rubra]|uniref:Bacterial surface antigen (D15) domain-containing protein n=1 Tax=Marinilabilia rubra TaxID=2162893 RepID=A0A2U2B6L6_9BACT|nr:hypothetical protein DDZ16_14570 [Marinilabilia rubra]